MEKSLKKKDSGQTTALLSLSFHKAGIMFWVTVLFEIMHAKNLAQ